MATFTWVGGADFNGPNSWITPANWVTDGVPAATFPNSTTDVANVNVDDGIKDAIISGGASLAVGNLNIGGTSNGAGLQGGHVIVGGGPEIGGGGGGTLLATGIISVTSTNSGGGLVGGPNGIISGPGLGLSGPGVIVGGGGAFNFTTIVNNGTIQADGANYNLGPLVLNDGTITGTGVIEVDNNSVMDLNAPTNNGIQVATSPGYKSTIVLEQPAAWTGGLNLLTPNTSLDVYFKGLSPTSVTYDPAGFLDVNGASGIIDRIPFISNGQVALSVIPSTLAGYGAIHLGPTVLAGIPAPVNGTSTTSLSSTELSQLLQGDQSAWRFIGGTEAVVLTDGTLSVGNDTNQAYLSRLYQGLLGREPDVNGLTGATASLAASDKATVAQAFVTSAEYQSAHPNQDNALFVNTLYQGMLGRPADAGGLSAWTQLLASGSTRGQIAATFADSAEAKQHLSYVTNAGQFTFDQNAAVVREDYRAAFGRDADAAGLASWTSALKAGTTPAQLAQIFAGSGEFQSLHGQQTNAQYVDSLYTNALGRSADAAGETTWVNALNAGASRADVLAAFAQSSESQARLTWALS